jgi:hypothetical protein
MFKKMLMLIAGLLLSIATTAQTSTTYYQNTMYQFRGTATRGYFSLYGTHYTAQDNSVIELNQIVVAPNFDCTTGGGTMGYVFYTSAEGVQQPCAIVTDVTLGPPISTNTNGRVCTGPSSEHVEFVGGYYDATYTFFFSFARFGGCYTKTLTSSVTLTTP